MLCFLVPKDILTNTANIDKKPAHFRATICYNAIQSRFNNKLTLVLYVYQNLIHIFILKYKQTFLSNVVSINQLHHFCLLGENLGKMVGDRPQGQLDCLLFLLLFSATWSASHARGKQSKPFSCEK